jgi:integrase
VKHHATLPSAEVSGFMRAVRGHRGIVARALEFTVLTAARLGEVLGAHWSEIAGEVWTVPATRMKGAENIECLCLAPLYGCLKPYRERATMFFQVSIREAECQTTLLGSFFAGWDAPTLPCMVSDHHFETGQQR